MLFRAKCSQALSRLPCFGVMSRSHLFRASGDGSEITPEWTVCCCCCSQSMRWSSTRGFRFPWRRYESIERRSFNSWPPGRLAAAPSAVLPSEACRCGLRDAEHQRAGCTAVCVCLPTVVAATSFIEPGLYVVDSNKLTPSWQLAPRRPP